jgi:sulfur carrier protein
VISVNGEPSNVAAPTTLGELLAHIGVDQAARGVAVALDGEVVPRRLWPTQSVADGAAVEVLGAIQGG